MRTCRKDENGYATILVIVSAALLFSLLAIALNGYVSWHRINVRELKKVQKSASKIIVHPQADL